MLCIPSALEEPLHTFIAGAFKIKDCACLQVGGMADHIHVLASIP
ncbi:MAG: transposase, partial [Verrucomicrobia bacterium]|nr:transposase [Verrucomicrobiota bacterium]